MVVLNAAQKKLLKEYPRALVHMRAQLRSRRLSLIFGAGLSKPFGLPTWPKLVEDIAADPEVEGQQILETFKGKSSLPYKTELLFQHYRNQRVRAADPKDVGSRTFENTTVAKWSEVWGKYLYKSAPADFNEALEKHPYILKFLPIIREAPITITYNFDDYIEQALFKRKDPKDTGLGYETVTNPWTQFRRSNAVIYHPHGVLPTQIMESPQDRLVFSESAYAKLFLGSLVGDFSFFLNHMSKNTCVIVGSSLEDEDLRSLLIQSAQGNPGNPHFCIHFMDAGKSLSPDATEAIRRTHFTVYNLITLFLNNDEIAALAELLDCGTFGDDAFAESLVEQDSSATFTFYLTGALGVGKSTTSGQLRNLRVLDEWTAPRPQVLAKPWDELTVSERAQADEWIATQFAIKNDILRREKFGIALVDRSPMDPLTFTPPGERPKKATALLEAITAGGKWPIADGMIILLVGDPEELAARVIATGKPEYTEQKLRTMESDLRSVYTGVGVRIVETRGRSIAEVAKMVSEIIHFEPYEQFKFVHHLNAFKKS